MEAPESGDLEVSVFGPGRGECITIHLGCGEWIVVDSCVDPATGRAAALRYFEDIGVDPASAVKKVVVTHWHDDHIRGVSDVFEAAQDAEFVCSGKLDPFILNVVAAGREVSGVLGGSGVDEFSRVLEVIRARRQPRQSTESAGPRWAQEGTILFRSTDRRRPAEVWALSPSAGTQTRQMHEVAGFLPKAAQPQRRASVRVGPNQRSIVLWVTAGEHSVLLGGDLEDSTNPAVGWGAVVTSNLRPTGRARVFKVPHHGSANADNPSVWAKMLTERPVAVLTPFAGGRKPLPSDEDIARLCTRTDLLYCTASRVGSKPQKRDPAVERMAEMVTRHRRTVGRKVGQVQVRLPIMDGGAEPSIQVYPPAHKLCA